MENRNDQENYRNEIYSKSVRAGRRTYFFDVKSTRSGDHYLTITESKKKFDQDGNFQFEKHKIFLYKEDFDKFKDGFIFSSEFLWLIVGGTIPFLIDKITEIASTAPAAPSKCPVIDFVEFILMFLA